MQPRPKEAGFTLIETLCVLVILGLAAGLVVLNFPERDSPLQSYVQTLSSELNRGLQESEIDGRPRAIGVSRSEVALFSYDQAWTQSFSRPAPDAVRLSLKIDGQTAKLPETPEALLVFNLATGAPDFTLTLSSSAQSFHLSPNARGQVIWEATR